MGVFMSKFMAPHKWKEIFMIQYLSDRGVTPYQLDLIPGGHLRDTDGAAVIRHKFKVALKRQRQLEKAIRNIEERGSPIRCLSPCMLIKEGQVPEQKVDQKAKICEFEWKDDRNGAQVSHDMYGQLSKLLVEPCKSLEKEFESEGSVANDVKDCNKGGRDEEPLRGSQSERRVKSRPDLRMRQEPCIGHRHVMSLTHVLKEPEPRMLPSIRETPSSVVVERIELGSEKNSRKVWPSKTAVKDALKNSIHPPTTYFLARFRPNRNSDYVEFDYRYNKITGQDSFACTGALEKLLTGVALQEYLSDRENNILNEKRVFFNNVANFFNSCEGRIWWNGYITSVDGNKHNRMKLQTLKIDPPSFVFDVTGLTRISGTRNFTRLSLLGNNDGGSTSSGRNLEACISRKFVLRARTENELTKIDIRHVEGTASVLVELPLLSGIPLSTTSSEAKTLDVSRTLSKSAVVFRDMGLKGTASNI